MHYICLNFQIHQPLHYRVYRFFDIGRDNHYTDDFQNRYITGRSLEKCYAQANKLLLSMIKQFGDFFKVSFTVSGISLDLFEQYNPEIIEGFKALAKTGNVEFLATPYYHSLASLKNKNEFVEQTLLHKERIQELFGLTPSVFSNTELIYSDEIGKSAYEMGFEGMLTEGAKHILGWKSPNYLYSNALKTDFKVLLRNFMLSDDIAFRFSNTHWSAYPLTAEKFVSWMNMSVENQDCINLFLDYRTLGEWQDKETGIFEFIRYLPKVVFENSDFKFCTPSELINAIEPVSPVYVPYPVSWSGEEKDMSLWMGNDLQKDAYDKLYKLEERVMGSQNPLLISQWRNLQSSDNFFWMNTKQHYVQGLHNPFHSPYDAFINYMNILSDFSIQLENSLKAQEEGVSPSIILSDKKSKPQTKTNKSKSVARKKKGTNEINIVDEL